MYIIPNKISYDLFLVQDAPDTYSANECISLPVYFSENREKIVTNLTVPCGGEQDHWTQTGAAMFLKSI